MSTNSEASRLNLEYYRKQAKALLKAAQAGEPSALERIRVQIDEPDSLKLHYAQVAIAREQGFPSWPRFRSFVLQSAGEFAARVGSFVEAALSNAADAEAMLARDPQLARAGLFAALVLGDATSIQQSIAANPAAAQVKGGPRHWEPLLYVCFSRLASGKSARAEGFVGSAQVLLHAGANPNASYTNPEWPDSPLSCLYAATGLNNDPALAEALLAHGADPNDGESLYHSTEHPDLSCVRLLLQHGASPSATNVLHHMLDREDPEGLRLLLAAGGDPNGVNQRGETALHWAVWRRRGTRIVSMLLDHGAALDLKRKDGRTAYAISMQTGQLETARLLESRGASTGIAPLDRLLGKCASAEPGELDGILADVPDILREPGSERLLPDLTANGHTSAVRVLLASGVPVDARGEHGATALHWACWHGRAELVRLLLEHHASLTVEDEQFHGTPAGWFGHGVQNCGAEEGEYAAVARLLLAAGAIIPKVDVPTGRPDVDAVLREYRLIG
ncbi:MAG: ankyrin repeat domain-containing protein [Bryobacteraceae bacterium]